MNCCCIVVALCFFSMIHAVQEAEEEKDAFSFEYTYELSEDETCHVVIVETITFNEYYIGNPKLATDFEADQVDTGNGGIRVVREVVDKRSKQEAESIL